MARTDFGKRSMETSSVVIGTPLDREAQSTAGRGHAAGGPHGRWPGGTQSPQREGPPRGVGFVAMTPAEIHHDGRAAGKPELVIRPAERGDLPQLTEIYNHYVIHTPVTFDLEPHTVEGRTAWFEQFA